MATKKTSSKKAVKKSSEKKAGKKKTGSVIRDRALKDLRSLITQIDEEGLEFLIRQAKVLIHNKEIEEKHERNLKAYNEKRPTVKKKASDSSVIEVIEAEDGKSFVILLDGYRNFFSLEEMRKLVKICHSADDEIDAADRLFNWFSRERSDVIKNSSLSGKNHKSLPAIYHCLVERYTVR